MLLIGCSINSRLFVSLFLLIVFVVILINNCVSFCSIYDSILNSEINSDVFYSSVFNVPDFYSNDSNYFIDRSILVHNCQDCSVDHINMCNSTESYKNCNLKGSDLSAQSDNSSLGLSIDNINYESYFEFDSAPVFLDTNVNFVPQQCIIFNKNDVEFINPQIDLRF